MNRRVKQLIYGLGYALFWLGVIALVYVAWLKPDASCFDGRQNQNEAGVDCGGVCQKSCAILTVRPVEVARVESVVVRDQAIAVVEIRNPNTDFGATGLNYALAVPDGLGGRLQLQDSTFIYPGEIRYRVLINVPVESFGAGAVDVLPYRFSTSTLSWSSVESFFKPVHQIRDIQTSYDQERKLLLVSGILKNDNDFALSEASVSAVVRGQTGALVGASKTLARDLAPRSERYFQVVVPIVAGTAAGDLGVPKLTVERVR